MATLRHNDVVVPLPPGWEDGTQIVAVGQFDGGFRPNMVISRDPANTASEAEFAQRQLPLLRTALDRYELKREAPRRLGGMSGFMREHTFVANGQQLDQLQFYVLAGDNVYTFTATHLAERFEQLLPTFEGIIARTQLYGQRHSQDVFLATP